MKALSILAPLFAAAPALAHEGAHLHPHGIDAAWLFLALPVIGVAAALAVARMRK
ncbi:hypothetical protein ACRDNQ_03165 [Palleronia sp. KMU-117]|uniref:hypothetical protein n=1 Tax=Palleronia sp. KMU-117 TaxID=3434108 RepID=UPI003D75859C